jgi:TM2 domain-containing membrane protein YozV
MIFLRKSNASAIFFIVLFLLSCYQSKLRTVMNNLPSNKIQDQNQSSAVPQKTYLENFESKLMNMIKDETYSIGLTINNKPFDYKSTPTIVLEKCDRHTCNPSHSYCMNSKICVCRPGFISITGSAKTCTYQMKKQIIALGLEMMFPLGAGHFYTGRILYGILKLLYFIYTLFILFMFYKSLKNQKENRQRNHQTAVTCKEKLKIILKYFLILIFVTFFSIWYVSDITNFALNRILDGNGITLASMIN